MAMMLGDLNYAILTTSYKAISNTCTLGVIHTAMSVSLLCCKVTQNTFAHSGSSGCFILASSIMCSCTFHTSSVTCINARGFSRLRTSAASCCFSSSTMDAKVIAVAAGGLPTCPHTHGLMRKEILFS